MIPVVDTHFHWYPRDWFERLADESGPVRAERVSDGYRLVFNQGRNVIPLPAPWFDLEAGLAASEDAAGADVAVVCTAGVLSGVLDQLSPSAAVAKAIEMNESLAKVQRERTERFFGTAFVPLLDTDAALDVLDHAVGELGLRGVNLPPVVGDEPVDSPRLEPFYARVQELGVPLIVHPTDLAFAPVLPGYGDALQRTVGRPFDSTITVLRLVFSGLMNRFPRLRVVHTHAGAFIPSQAGRIDKNARIADLPERPSVYLRRMYTDTVAPEAASSIRSALDFYGSDHVLYGTDYPCWRPRAAVAEIDSLGLDADGAQALYRRNARAAFDLP